MLRIMGYIKMQNKASHYLGKMVRGVLLLMRLGAMFLGNL
jgi:hypothetical protein